MKSHKKNLIFCNGNDRVKLYVISQLQNNNGYKSSKRGDLTVKNPASLHPTALKRMKTTPYSKIVTRIVFHCDMFKKTRMEESL